MKSNPLIEINNLCVCHQKKQILKKIDITLFPNETVALVGYSGSGKSMTAHAILRLLSPLHGFSISGTIFFNGKDLNGLSIKEMRKIRGKEIGMAFQEALHALDPLMKIGRQIKEALPKNKQSKEKVYELLDYVGIADPSIRYHHYPNELSGGMKQRVMIAIALAGEPKLLIADEPTTALDVTIQSQIFELLKKIQQEKALTILLITHDLGLVAGFCDRAYVIEKGEIIEKGSVDHLFYTPKHPFTKNLLQIAKERLSIR